MATKKFIIEVEEGETKCEYCPFVGSFNGCKYYIESIGTLMCYKYNLATTKIKEYEDKD